MRGQLPITLEDGERGFHDIEIVGRGSELVIQNVDRPLKLFALGEEGGQDVGESFFRRVVGIVHEWDNSGSGRERGDGLVSLRHNGGEGQKADDPAGSQRPRIERDASTGSA